MFKHAPALLALIAATASLAFAQPASRPAAKPAEPAKAVTAPAAASATQHVVVHTSQGDITLELYPDKAPKTVDNFLQYANSGFYAGTVFHRVIPNFMIQGGGFTKELQLKRTRAPIRNEANNGLSNLKYTVSMARTGDPHSAAAQFFINLVDNKRLDYTADTNGLTWGYCVFGKVIKGQDVVDKIGTVPTGASGPLPSDVPTTPITIDKVEVAQ
ncbi:MAG: peptidyl-prolyl cis-trans isomerase [Gammaproteobacteria bacterium]|nr:MAG: peptidyl-prolyl cis-trans isomerase [Gammaproteobacteria bacterium]